MILLRPQNIQDRESSEQYGWRNSTFKVFLWGVVDVTNDVTYV